MTFFVNCLERKIHNSLELKTSTIASSVPVYDYSHQQGLEKLDANHRSFNFRPNAQVVSH